MRFHHLTASKSTVDSDLSWDLHVKSTGRSAISVVSDSLDSAISFQNIPDVFLSTRVPSHSVLFECLEELFTVQPRQKPAYIKYVMDILQPFYLDIVLSARRGAVLALPEAVHTRQHGRRATQHINPAALKFIASLYNESTKQQMLWGLSLNARLDELAIRALLCQRIRKVPQAELPLNTTAIVAGWQAFLDNCLAQREEDVLGYAAADLALACVTSSPPGNLTAARMNGELTPIRALSTDSLRACMDPSCRHFSD